MADDSRRGKVTDEHRLEAARLKAIFLARKDKLAEKGVATQKAFGERFGIGNQAAVGFFLNGHTALSLKAARGFAKGLGCAIEEFSPRLAAEAKKTAEVSTKDALTVLEIEELELITAFRELGTKARHAVLTKLKDAAAVQQRAEAGVVESFSLPFGTTVGMPIARQSRPAKLVDSPLGRPAKEPPAQQPKTGKK